MAKDYYSILLLPSKAGKIKKLKLSQFAVRSGAFFLTTILVVLGFIVFDYINIKLEGVNLESLKEENQRQRVHIQSFATKVEALESHIVALKQFDSKLRVIANLEKPRGEDQTLSVGGSLNEHQRSSPVFDKTQDVLIKRMHSDLEQLKTEASIQEHSLQELYEFLKEQKSILVSTPSLWPARGWVSSGFGYRKSPFTGLREFHKGIDIATRLGTPVIAPADGIVTYVGRKGGFGKIIIINHGYGIVTRYAHLLKTFKKSRQKVKRGEKIAAVGNTGRSTGSHLHYEIRVDGVAVNPWNYLLN